MKGKRLPSPIGLNWKLCLQLRREFCCSACVRPRLAKRQFYVQDVFHRLKLCFCELINDNEKVPLCKFLELLRKSM